MFEFVVRSLLSNEFVVIRVLEEFLRDFFVLLFIVVFLGGYKKILTVMVRVWFFRCFYVGILSVRELYYEIVEVVIDGL